MDDLNKVIITICLLADFIIVLLSAEKTMFGVTVGLLVILFGLSSFSFKKAYQTVMFAVICLTELIYFLITISIYC